MLDSVNSAIGQRTWPRKEADRIPGLFWQKTLDTTLDRVATTDKERSLPSCLTFAPVTGKEYLAKAYGDAFAQASPYVAPAVRD